MPKSRGNIFGHPLYFTEEQKEILFVTLLSHNEVRHRINDLLTSFKLAEQGLPAISIDTICRLDKYSRFIIHILQEIDVLIYDDNRFYLNKKKLRLFDPSLLNVVALDESSLDKIILFQKKFSRAAENFIVEWEKHRLVFQGNKNLLNLVHRVSSENVNLGYDIASVDGGKSGSNDRFIEVKSSSGTDFSFYWTINEIERAKEAGKNYWIYFVPREHLLPIKLPMVYIIRNPSACLGKTLKYTEKSFRVWCEPFRKQSKKNIYFGDDWCGVYY